KIAVATTPSLAKLVMTAKATTPDGRSTSVQAVVDYRPDETNVANRVAINSLGVLKWLRRPERSRQVPVRDAKPQTRRVSCRSDLNTIRRLLARQTLDSQ